MAEDTVREDKEDAWRDDVVAAVADGGGERGDASVRDEADEALHGLRAAVDRAAHTLCRLSRGGEAWAVDAAKGAEARAVEIGNELRGQGGRAAGAVARRVEQNPLASLAVAFALGCLCGALRRR